MFIAAGAASVIADNSSSGGASYRQGRAIGSTIFVRALPRALPLGQEAKKVKSPWSIISLT